MEGFKIKIIIGLDLVLNPMSNVFIREKRGDLRDRMAV